MSCVSSLSNRDWLSSIFRVSGNGLGEKFEEAARRGSFAAKR
jgi:hypothetical protein